MRYKVTVEITMEANSTDEATDGVGEIVRPFERPFDGKDGLDWRIAHVWPVVCDTERAEARGS